MIVCSLPFFRGPRGGEAYEDETDATVRQCSNMSIQRGEEVVRLQMVTLMICFALLTALSGWIETRGQEGKGRIRGICDHNNHPKGLYWWYYLSFPFIMPSQITHDRCRAL